MKINNDLWLKILVVLAYLAMITVNYLANALPIGGVTTGEASDAYPNLFTPVGFTFSIWGLIYALLAGFVVYFVIHFGKKGQAKRNRLLKRTGQLFIVSSLANISWIFAWHHGLIPLSVVIMLVLLGSLILLADLINREKYSITEKIWLRLPFSIYFGWITVATIANISVLLVSLNWSRWGIADEVWTVIILLVGAAIGIARSLKDKNIPYILVLVWAYGGIWFKHNSAGGFSGQYPNIILTLGICMLLFLGTTGWIAFQDHRKSLK